MRISLKLCRLSGIFETMDCSYELAEEEISKGEKLPDKTLKQKMLDRLEISEDSMKRAIKMVGYSDELFNTLIKHQFDSKSQELPGKSRGVYYTNMEDPIGELPEDKAVSFHLHIDRIYHKSKKLSGNMVCSINCLVK